LIPWDTVIVTVVSLPSYTFCRSRRSNFSVRGGEGCGLCKYR